MSKISIEGNASGTGTLTIAAPNTNSNYTLTLPTETGTILTGSGNQAGSFTTLNTSGQVVFNDAGADVDFRVEGDTEANLLFVDAGNDRVGIGTNVPGFNFDVVAKNRSAGKNYSTTDMLASTIAVVGGVENDLSKAATLTLNQFNSAGSISVGYTSTFAGFMAFGTSNGSQQSPVERMRINSSGSLLVNTTTPTGQLDVQSTVLNRLAYFNNTVNTNGNQGVVVNLGSNCDNTTSYAWISAISGSDKYYIFGNGTTGTPSDIRLKKNIETARDGYVDDLSRLRIVKYNWKTDEENTPKELGVIAQEVEQVFPGIVSSRVNEQTGEETKAVKHSVFVPMLIKAVQELKAELDEAKTRIAALETGA